MSKTNIEWCTDSINPIIGCSHSGSPGCDHCFAQAMAHRLGHNPNSPQYAGLTENGIWTGEIRWNESGFQNLLHIPGKCKRVFVGSMTDLFYPKVEDEWLDRIMAAVALQPQHTFLFLTKRPKRMVIYFNDPYVQKRVANKAGISTHFWPGDGLRWNKWPLKNLWLGVTVCNQAEANEKIPLLLDTPAAKRFVSIEPMLGEVSLTGIMSGVNDDLDALRGLFFQSDHWNPSNPGVKCEKLDWVIAGSESGPKARPMNIEWARIIKDQCIATDTPFFLKQATIDGKLVKMPELDGKVWEQVPQ